MDRNSAIGLTLIAALLLAYFYWFAPSPPPPSAKPATETQASTQGKLKPTPQTDSVAAAAYGDLSAFVKGNETPLVVETADLKITFSNKGATVREVELKQYKTYSQQPLRLITPERNTFNLTANYKANDIDLYNLYYKAEQTRKGDSTVVIFSIALQDGSSITHQYAIPDKGYEVNYTIKQSGLTQNLNGENITFLWNNRMVPTEKDLQETRDNSTICYYTGRRLRQVQ
jgi:YidC/Oxa1 family membrane protein insertase